MARWPPPAARTNWRPKTPPSLPTWRTCSPRTARPPKLPRFSAPTPPTAKHSQTAPKCCSTIARTTSPSRASIGVVYLRAGKPDQAIGELNRAVAKAPGDALIHLHLAFAFDRKAYREYVRTELNTALDCHPTDEVRQAIEELRALLDLPR
jgi:hypothetical protein